MKAAVDIIRKYSIKEVALLVVFALGLLIASVIVTRRSRIEMSEPIELPGSGLSLSLPTGRGWQTAKSWAYTPRNQFVLKAELLIGTELAAFVRCEYLIAPETISAKELLDKNVAAARVRVARSGQIITDDITIEWAQLVRPHRSADIFLGIARLPSGKVLAINVHAPNDHLLAAKLFSATANNVRFQTDELQTKGADLIGRIKADGLDSTVEKYAGFGAEAAWLIADVSGRPAGFQIKAFRKNVDNADWSALKIEIAQYAAGGKAGFTVLECTRHIDRFLWQTGQTTMRSLTAASEIQLAPDGQMRVGKASGRQYWPGPAAIPEICLDLISAKFLDSYMDQAVIDVIFSDGQIKPARISSADPSQDANNKWGASYAVRIDFLTGDATWRQTYFDFKKQPLGKVQRSKETLIWHRTDRQTLTDRFGNLERYLGKGSILN